MGKWIGSGFFAWLFCRRGLRVADQQRGRLSFYGLGWLICFLFLSSPNYLQADPFKKAGLLGWLGLLISAGISDYLTCSLSLLDECLVALYLGAYYLWKIPERLLFGMGLCSSIGIVSWMLGKWKHQQVFGEGDYLIILCNFLVLDALSALTSLWLASLSGMIVMLMKHCSRLPFVPFLALSAILVFLFS